MNGGRVSLSAKNATVGQILAEWARVGQTKIINGERVPGEPLTLELTNVPEIEAIEIILRSAGGYLVAPRQTEIANASRYDRILIMPTSSPVRPAAVVAAPPPMPPPFNRPPQVIQPWPVTDDNDDPASQAPGNPGAPPNTQPPFNTFPQPPRTGPPPPASPTSAPRVPAGVAAPGMIVAPAPAPGQAEGTAQPQ
jgi:hypothetical protein